RQAVRLASIRYSSLLVGNVRVKVSPSETITAAVFLDTGAQRSFMNADFACRLPRNPKFSEDIMVSGFDGVPKRYLSPIHEVSILQKNNNVFIIKLAEIPDIVG